MGEPPLGSGGRDYEKKERGCEEKGKDESENYGIAKRRGSSLPAREGALADETAINTLKENHKGEGDERMGSPPCFRKGELVCLFASNSTVKWEESISECCSGATRSVTWGGTRKGKVLTPFLARRPKKNRNRHGVVGGGWPKK